MPAAQALPAGAPVLPVGPFAGEAVCRWGRFAGGLKEWLSLDPASALPWHPLALEALEFVRGAR